MAICPHAGLVFSAIVVLSVAACDCGDAAEPLGSGRARPAVESLEDGFVYAELRPHPAPSELEAGTNELGEGWVMPADESLPSALEGELRAVYFDVETGTFPNHHDELLRELAALAPTALPDARFDEHPPPFESGEPYVLTASLGGRSHAVVARDLEDWFDVETVVGLLNSLAREAGNPTRWQQLRATDQGATIVVGPGPVIERAIAQGLFSRAEPGQSRALGKAAEEQALERIRAGSY